jgi:GNAT superfamily N-acetyltransferase
VADNLAIRIRPMVINDLVNAIGLSRSEGWNQTDKDWRFLMMNPDNVCLAAEQGNKLVGTATATVHSSKLAWIGMVLVDKNLRGLGVGRNLMINIINNLKHINSIKLDATPAGLPLYQKLGFIEEHHICRMVNPLNKGLMVLESGYKPEIIEKNKFPDILKLDKKIFGSDRSSLLRSLFQNYPEKAYMINKDGKTNGYIFGREGIRYDYIGPASSFSKESFMSLITIALNSMAGKPVALDILQDKHDVIRRLELSGFEIQRSFVRMYLKNNHYPGEVNFQYLISGPEFG